MPAEHRLRFGAEASGVSCASGHKPSMQRVGIPGPWGFAVPAMFLSQWPEEISMHRVGRSVSHSVKRAAKKESLVRAAAEPAPPRFWSPRLKP